MKRTGLYSAGLLLGLALASLNGCAAMGGGSSSDAIRNDIQAIDAYQKKELGKAAKQVDAIKKDVDTIKVNNADATLKHDEINTAISVLDGRVGEAMEMLRSLTQDMQTLNNRLDQIGKKLFPGEEAGAGESPSAEGESMFNQAYLDFLKEKYDMAIDGFKSFINANASNPRANEAQYWIGECYYSQGKFKEAVKEFQKVLDTYPEGSKRADAMLKVGLSHYAAKDSKRAREAFQQVVDTFPHTRQAGIAAERLQGMK